MGVVLLPGTAYLDLALHVGNEIGAEEVSELTLEAPLTMDERSSVLLQVAVGELEESGHRTVDILRCAQPFDGAPWEQAWTRHATGVLAPAADHSGLALGDPRIEAMRQSWPPRGAERVDTAGVYERLAEHGFDYGPAFQGLRAVWKSERELFAEVSLPEAQHSQAGAFAIHPALFDAAFHAAIDDGVRGSRTLGIHGFPSRSAECGLAPAAPAPCE